MRIKLIEEGTIACASIIHWKTEDGSIFYTKVQETLNVLLTGDINKVKRFLKDTLKELETEKKKRKKYEQLIEKLRDEGIDV